MINQQLLHPKSIVVVGGSEQIQKPGGKVLFNLIKGGYAHPLYVVNPGSNWVQGIRSFSSVAQLPGEVDLAILAIPAKFCLEAVTTLVEQKQTRAFIILSAGFGEENEQGALIEQNIARTIAQCGGSLIGPNCIGILTPGHHSVFTEPIPVLQEGGIDFITGSGATAVFILEAAQSKGLTFHTVFSVGNASQIGVEEVLEHFDLTFDPKTSSRVKLLYMESIRNPEKLFRHAQSLIAKGCWIVAIKSGNSEAGSRAASSHTGAMASNDLAVSALFRKAGIIRCEGREELVNVAAVLSLPALPGNRMAIVTHAGGPAVMLTDALSKGGIKIPAIDGEAAQLLLQKLFPGSSVGNPIDFLATGTAEQLGHIVDAVEHDFDQIDGMAVIFGSPGLSSVADAYEVLHEKMQTCRKPIFPVLPSVVNVKSEMEAFVAKGNICFSDEVEMAKAICKVYSKTIAPEGTDEPYCEIDTQAVRNILNRCHNGYLSPGMVQQLLDAAGLPRVLEVASSDLTVLLDHASLYGFPLVMKVVGPVHKSDVGGVVLNISSTSEVESVFERLMQIPGADSVLMQPMATGRELFVGAVREGAFGHLMMFGLGGIFIEVLHDVSVQLAPLRVAEARQMIHEIKGYPLIQGIRGELGIPEHLLIDVLMRCAALLNAAPEIAELDINPLLGNNLKVVAVDARIRIECY